MDIQTDINWKIFTAEEKGILIAAYKNGEVNNLACLPNVVIDTPEKEAEIEKMVLELYPMPGESESDVRQHLETFWEQGKVIETPEEEAKWQEKIDKEKAKQNKQRQKQKEEAREKTLKQGIKDAKENVESKEVKADKKELENEIKKVEKEEDVILTPEQKTSIKRKLTNEK